MSFGWSAGDIAAAITLTYNLIQALDTCDGAAADYREAVSFLRDLKRTLEPLQKFTAYNANPAYGREIEEQVRCIKEPVEHFLAAVLKYEPSLGAAAKEGHHRHIFRKLQWYIFMSKKVLGLRKKIESHMRIIDTLMQRLTLDAVSATQRQLPLNLQLTFQQTIRPELIAILRENLVPLNSTLIEGIRTVQNTSHGVLGTRLAERYGDLSAGIQEIKDQIKDSNNTQMRIESCLRGEVTRRIARALPTVGHRDSDLYLGNESTDRNPNQPTAEIIRQSLMEVYYLVFLYLGHFLRNLFLVLSRMVQPTKALMPILLAQYNISFLDAIGRPVRVLPYEYFRSFKVLQAFIEHEFKDLPGSEWVGRGRYLVMSLVNNRQLNERNWSGNVTPGAIVAMSMVVRKRLEPTNSSNEERCPESSCSGIWTKSSSQSWVTCPVCQKQIFNSPAGELDMIEEVATLKTTREESPGRESPRSREKSSNASKHFSPPRPLSPKGKIEEDQLDFDDNDISLFKRVVQEIIELRHSPSDDAPTGIETIGLVLSRFERLDPIFELAREGLASLEEWAARHEFSELKQFLDSERAVFKATATRLMALAKMPDSKGVSSVFEPWQNSEVTQAVKSTLGADVYGEVSYALLAIFQAVNRILALFPQDTETEGSPGLLSKGLVYKSKKKVERMLIDFGAKGTERFAVLEARIKEFEDLINSAENSLHIPKSLESPRRRQVISVISPPDSAENSSDDEDTKSSRGRQLENLQELQAAIRMIEQHRENSPERTSVNHSTSVGSDISSDDSDGVVSRRNPPMLRKIGGELVKPALRPSRIRRHPPSMPGTPTLSKAVHFDSNLEHVRHFLQIDRPLATSAGGSPIEKYEAESEFPFGGPVLERPVQVSKLARPASGQLLSKSAHRVGWTGKTNFESYDSDVEFPFNDDSSTNMPKMSLQQPSPRIHSGSSKPQLPRSTSYLARHRRTPSSNTVGDVEAARSESIAANSTNNFPPTVPRESQISAQNRIPPPDSANKKQSFNYKNLPNPNSPTFGNRYDFGASLSAAINATNSTLKDRSREPKKSVEVKPDI